MIGKGKTKIDEKIMDVKRVFHANKKLLKSKLFIKNRY